MYFFVPRLLKRAALALFAGVLSLGAAAQQTPADQGAVRVALIESLSGPFANTGEAVLRNLVWAAERVNARGGIKLPGGNRPLVFERYDSKDPNGEALSALRSAIDDGITLVAQGSSSATTAVLIDAINKHNEREPAKRVRFMNYSAGDPVLIRP